jgi:signal transduction histidine kinase/DNA-binding response OmpR family regulator
MDELKVLLVEDSPDDAELVALELRRGGYRVRERRVETAADMAAALAVGGWNLVLSDYRLPGFSGLDALAVLKASELDIPFILVSGAVGEEEAVAALKAGAHDYVLKDHLARLCPAVARELRDAGVRAEQARAKEALRRSEERYRGLFEHSPIPLSVQDYSGVKALLDRYRADGVQDLAAFFQDRPGELRRCAEAVAVREQNGARRRFLDGAGGPPCRQYTDGSWPVFRAQLAALAAGGTTFQGEMPIRLPGGDERVIALHLSVSPGYEPTLGRVLVSSLDVTGRIRMENALRDLDRLSAKGQMAAYVAHEINNPLAGIKNAFALLVPAIPADHPHRRYADLIMREIDRIAGIIRTLYHVYRPPTAEQGPVALQEVFQDIQSLLAPKCRAARAEIRLDLPEPGLQARCNGGLLRQVLFNLAQNAVEASPRGGAVVLGARRSGAGIGVTVRDQGGGIPPEWAERVFEPGFTSKGGSAMSGLGLGLATCKSIVRSMGGTLDFSGNDPEPGCTFRVVLPPEPPR